MTPAPLSPERAPAKEAPRATGRREAPAAEDTVARRGIGNVASALALLLLGCCTLQGCGGGEVDDSADAQTKSPHYPPWIVLPAGCKSKQTDRCVSACVLPVDELVEELLSLGPLVTASVPVWGKTGGVLQVGTGAEPCVELPGEGYCSPPTLAGVHHELGIGPDCYDPVHSALRTSTDSDYFPTWAACWATAPGTWADWCVRVAARRAIWIWGRLTLPSAGLPHMGGLMMLGEFQEPGYIPPYCLQTTPAGLVGRYRLAIDLPATTATETLQAHAEIQYDEPTTTWRLHINGVPATADWHLADQDATALVIGDGFLDFELAVTHVPTGATANVPVHLDSVASRLEGTLGPLGLGGAGLEAGTGKLVLHACVNEAYPGPC